MIEKHSLRIKGRQLMKSICETVNRETMPSLVVRTRCSIEQLPEVLGQSYQRILAHLSSINREPAGPPYVGYHNEDMQDLDLEIGFPVGADVAAEDEIMASEIPAGRYATTMHIGPYAEIAESYEHLTSWVEQQLQRPAGSAYEIYLNDPATTPEEGLQTLIIFPLA